MEAFEKFWQKEIKPYIHNPEDKEAVKYGWRAALEWALSNFMVVDAIEEELNDGN
jgi:hypothetical protein